MPDTPIFYDRSSDGAFTGTAFNGKRIYLTYKAVRQEAWLTREDAIWLSEKIIEWSTLGEPIEFYESTERHTFAVTAVDTIQIFVWFEIMQQGTWIKKSAALSLANLIKSWYTSFS